MSPTGIPSLAETAELLALVAELAPANPWASSWHQALTLAHPDGDGRPIMLAELIASLPSLYTDLIEFIEAIGASLFPDVAAQFVAAVTDLEVGTQ